MKYRIICKGVNNNFYFDEIVCDTKKDAKKLIKNNKRTDKETFNKDGFYFKYKCVKIK